MRDLTIKIDYTCVVCAIDVHYPYLAITKKRDDELLSICTRDMFHVRSLVILAQPPNRDSDFHPSVCPCALLI